MAALIPPTDTQSVVVSVGVALLMTVLWRLFDWVWLRPKKLERILRQQGLPGTSYKLYYGDLNDAERASCEAESKPMDEFSNSITHRVRPLHTQLLKNYGRTFFFWEGPIPVINIAEPELIREVLNRNFEFKRARINPILDNSFIRGLDFHEGQKWSQHRKLISPSFHTEKLKLMLPSIYTSCKEVITKWENMLPLEGTQNKVLEIDVWTHMLTLSADSISRAAFGSSYDEGKSIFELIKELMTIAVKIQNSVYFPGQRFLPLEDDRKIREVNRKMKTLLSGIIDKRIRENKGAEIKNDLLGLLIGATLLDQEKEFKLQKVQFIRLTIEEVIEECKMFYIAGTETVSNFLTWTMLLLAKHQEWQTRAREEVRAIFDDNDPDFEGLNHLKTMTMIFHEVLRLYPPISEVRREVRTTKPIKLGDLSLPNGVMINLPFIFCNHDPDQWGKDVEEFNPGRFAEGISKAAPSKDATFMPFGGGPRICIGINFTMVEAKLAMTMILQRFSFQLSPSYAHAPAHFGLLYPQFGAPILLKRL